MMKNQHLVSGSVLEKVINRKKKTNSVFNVKSKATEKEYTYKINRSEWKGMWYTHVRVETRYLHFKYIGSYFNGKIGKNKSTNTSPSATAIAWILRKVEQKKFNYWIPK